MEYKPLKLIFYENKENFEAEYLKRFNSYSTVKTGLYIHPFDRGERITSKEYEIFYIHLTKHQILEQKILDNSKKIKNYLSELPGLANQKLFIAQIIDEIQSSNDIEGVFSTKKELGSVVLNTNKSSRFKGIVNMYLNFGKKKFKNIDEITKIREIYDQLFKGDIPKDYLPDGNLFRKNVVYIGTKTKKVHQGDPNEETIIKNLNRLVVFMNRKDIPFLLKCVITHYYFEYIHPFYDGNGRMGRFLMSNYLTRKLDPLTGVTISNAVIHNKNKYEKSFSEVSNPRNKGDLTFFVQALYELIIAGQHEIIEGLENSSAKLTSAHRYLEDLNVDDDSHRILSILIQNYLFDDLDEPIKDLELCKILDVSNYKLKNWYKKLVKDGYVVKTGKNPSIHELSDDFKKCID